MKTKRAIVFELNNLTGKEQIILGHLTYHAGRLWNQANYLVKNRLAKPDYRDLYNKLKDTSLHLRSLQSRSAQIVLNELTRGWSNFFKFLENPKKFKDKGIEVVKPPKYANPKTPHKVVTWDKTGFKIKGSKIRLSISKGLKEHLREKFGVSFDYLWIEPGYKELESFKVLNVQIVPYKSYGQISFKVVVVYEKEVSKVKPKEIKLIDESYTSLTDSCDETTAISKQSKGQGRRIKRGLFLSSVKGLIKADVNGARNILRKFKKNWFELVTGLKRIVRLRIYKLGKGISESLLFARIGVEGSVNLPRGIRVGMTYQTPLEAHSVRAE
ncbi:hypothetical protein JCM12298_30390 [Desulfothermus naphthae]